MGRPREPFLKKVSNTNLCITGEQILYLLSFNSSDPLRGEPDETRAERMAFAFLTLPRDVSEEDRAEQKRLRDAFALGVSDLLDRARKVWPKGYYSAPTLDPTRPPNPNSKPALKKQIRNLTKENTALATERAKLLAEIARLKAERE